MEIHGVAFKLTRIRLIIADANIVVLGEVFHKRLGEAAIVREVELLCGETPWVFARTLIPATSLRGPARRLAMLGDTVFALGEGEALLEFGEVGHSRIGFVGAHRIEP